MEILAPYEEGFLFSQPSLSYCTSGADRQFDITFIQNAGS